MKLAIVEIHDVTPYYEREIFETLLAVLKDIQNLWRFTRGSREEGFLIPL